MENHIKAVGIIHIAFGALAIILAIGLFSLLTTVAKLSEDPEAMRVLPIIATLFSWFLIVLSVPEVIGGIGLIKHQSWARILVLIVSFLSLINFPVGTAIGIYSIWVLFDKRTEKILLNAGEET